jgi:hypothetical protein
MCCPYVGAIISIAKTAMKNSRGPYVLTGVKNLIKYGDIHKRLDIISEGFIKDIPICLIIDIHIDKTVESETICFSPPHVSPL